MKKLSLRGSLKPKYKIKKTRQNNYYPFGLKHKGYNEIANSNRSEEAEAIKYNGKEYEDSFGLNIYEMDLRQYDPAIGRWVVQDPVIHHDFSPYSAFDNNPVFWSDPSGADATQILDKEGNLVGGSFTGQDAIDAFNLLAGFSAAEKLEVTVQEIMVIDTAPDGDEGGGGDGNGNNKSNKEGFQPAPQIYKIAREMSLKYGYTLQQESLIVAWLKKHTVIEKNGIVTLNGINGLSVNINKPGLLIEKLVETGITSGSKFAFKKFVSYGTNKLIGGVASMTLFQTQSLNNSPTYQQRAFEQAQRTSLINSAGETLINYIFQRPVNVQEASMLNNFTRTVTPTGVSLWQTKYY